MRWEIRNYVGRHECQRLLRLKPQSRFIELVWDGILSAYCTLLFHKNCSVVPTLEVYVVVISPNSLLVFGNLFFERSVSLTHINMLSVSTRDLIDYTCLLSLYL